MHQRDGKAAVHLRADPADTRVEDGFAAAGRAPYALQQCIAGQGPPAVAQEVSEEVEVAALQRDRFPSLRNRTTLQVELKVGNLQDGLFRAAAAVGPMPLPGLAAPHR